MSAQAEGEDMIEGVFASISRDASVEEPWAFATGLYLRGRTKLTP